MSRADAEQPPSADGPGPERPPTPELFAALRVRRNAAAGLAVGVGVAALVYAIRVLELLGPTPDRGSPFLFLGLAFVLALSLAALVAAALTAARAARLSVAGED